VRPRIIQTGVLALRTSPGYGVARRSGAAHYSLGALRQRSQVHVSSSGPSCSNQALKTGLASLGASDPAGILQGEPGLLSGAASLPAKMPFGTPMLVCSFVPCSGSVIGAVAIGGCSPRSFARFAYTFLSKPKARSCRRHVSRLVPNRSQAALFSVSGMAAKCTGTRKVRCHATKPRITRMSRRVGGHGVFGGARKECRGWIYSQQPKFP
jgi:hypothetical protein